jgi:outer membrane protein assembly factor BamB
MDNPVQAERSSGVAERRSGATSGGMYFVEKHASANVYAVNPDGTQKWVKNIGGSLNYGGLVLDENGIIYGGSQKVGTTFKVYAIDTAAGEFVFNNEVSKVITR